MAVLVVFRGVGARVRVWVRSGLGVFRTPTVRARGCLVAQADWKQKQTNSLPFRGFIVFLTGCNLTSDGVIRNTIRFI